MNKKYRICIDESGIGAIAGPMTIGAVLWNDEMLENPKIQEIKKWIRDSKKLSKFRRYKIEPILKEVISIYSVITVSSDTIDSLGVHNAKKKAFLESIDNVINKTHINICDIESIVIDGNDYNKHTGLDIPQKTLINGDALDKGISVASIYAKCERDRKMTELSSQYPAYGWEKNAGYGTAKHIEAMHINGLTEQHRRSYKICAEHICLL